MQQGKNEGKTIFPGSGNINGFWKMSGNFGTLNHVRELSGNFAIAIKFLF